MIVVKLIKPEETYTIRKNELRKNMTLSVQLNNDFDVHTFHYGLFNNQKLVSIVSYMQASYNGLEGQQYQLRGMATDVANQGKGFGKILVQKSLDDLRKKNVDIIWCKARVVAIEFYKKQGFKIIGDAFDIPQIGTHFVMFKKL